MSEYFDMLAYLMGKQAGGGGGDVTVESKSINSNGTYTAPTGKAYSPVTVNVPNSYAAGDEGKVVSNGALVAQGSDTVTQNGTVDTTLINSLAVNVPGESSWTLLTSKEEEVNTASTTETSVDSIIVQASNLSLNDIFWVHVRDKAGKRKSYFYGSDCVVLFRVVQTSGASYLRGCFNYDANGIYQYVTSLYGIYVKSIAYSNGQMQINLYAKYSSASSGTIDGTYKVDVYKLTPASGMVPMFE